MQIRAISSAHALLMRALSLSLSQPLSLSFARPLSLFLSLSSSLVFTQTYAAPLEIYRPCLSVTALPTPLTHQEKIAHLTVFVCCFLSEN